MSSVELCFGECLSIPANDSLFGFLGNIVKRVCVKLTPETEKAQMNGSDTLVAIVSVAQSLNKLL